jgi:hypothetical protein
MYHGATTTEQTNTRVKVKELEVKVKNGQRYNIILYQCLRLKTCILAVRTKIFFIVDSGADGF